MWILIDNNNKKNKENSFEPQKTNKGLTRYLDASSPLNSSNEKTPMSKEQCLLCL